MKRSIAVLAAVTTLLTGNAIAQPMGQMHGRGAGEGKRPMMGVSFTDEQRAKMSDLRVKFLKETESVRADVEKQQSALRLEMTAEKFNESRVKSIQSEIAKLQADLGWKRVSHQRAVRDLLTPDQQKQFDARVLSGGPGAGAPGGRGMMMSGKMPGRRGMHQCEDCSKKD
jgi:Spy/CpxP family protein refolding chaperone